MPKRELEFSWPTDHASWRAVPGDATGRLQELILSGDPETSDYTRLLRFPAGTDTTPNGTLTHDFWEEVWILEGSLRDLRLGETFVAGMYACRPPGMPHGPWRSDEGALTIEFRHGPATG